MEKTLTESEKIEQLMRPRYKVMVKYPDSPYRVGQVLSTVTTLSGKQFLSGQTLHPDNFSDIFRKLEWWEERKPDEMPDYVKHKKEELGRVYKARFDFESTSKYWMFLEDTVVHPWNPSDFLPATESEYNSYLTSRPTGGIKT